MRHLSKKQLEKISAKQIGIQVHNERQSRTPIGVGLRFTPVVSMGKNTMIGVLGANSTHTTLN